MRLRIKMRLVVTLSFLSCCALVFLGETLAQEPDHYFVDGKRIALTPSQKYSALKLKSDTDVTAMTTLRANIDRSQFGTVEESPILKLHNIMLVKIREGVGPTSFRAGTEKFRAREEVESEIPVYEVGGINQVLVNEFIIQFKPEATETQIQEFLAGKNAAIIKKNEKIQNRYLIEFTGISAKEALSSSNQIYGNPLIEFIEPNFIRIYPKRPEIKEQGQGVEPSAPSPSAPSPSTIPMDPLYIKQWYLNNPGQVGVRGADVDASDAWKIHKGSEEITIAIIDEGVDTTHDDLKDKIIGSYDATDGDDNQEPNSWDGHGTACAGIAAAVTNNAKGISGIGWKIKILPVRIAYSSYDGGGWITSSSVIEDGIREAVNRGANVLSNSWGGGTNSSAINSALDYAIANNRVIVFAAGNHADGVIYPANLSLSKTIITVSATNEWDKLKTPTSQDGENWWGSCYGPEITVCAPGVHICTTDISGSKGYANGDYVFNFNGTSSATPLVAGVAALVLSKNPSWTPDQVRNHLKSTADDLGTPGFDNEYGSGRVNAYKALDGDNGTCTSIATVGPTNSIFSGKVLVNIGLLFSTGLLFLLFLIVRKVKELI